MKRAALVGVLASTAALARDVTRERSAPAVVSDRSSCVALTEDRRQIALSDPRTTSVQKPGWMVLTCSGKLPAEVRLPGTTRLIDGDDTGAPCETTLGTTPYWREIIAVDGQVTISCRYIHMTGDDLSQDLTD